MKESGIPLPVDEIAAEMSKIKALMLSINNLNEYLRLLALYRTGTVTALLFTDH